MAASVHAPRAAGADHPCHACCRAAGCQPEQAALREQLSAGAPLLVAVSAAAPVQLALDPAVLTAVSRLGDGVLQLSAAPPPEGPATQATLQLNCDVVCTLGQQGAPLTLTARSLRAVACSSLGSLAGASVAAVAVASLELARPGGEAGASCPLALAAGQQGSEGRRTAALQLFAALR